MITRSGAVLESIEVNGSRTSIDNLVALSVIGGNLWCEPVDARGKTLDGFNIALTTNTSTLLKDAVSGAGHVTAWGKADGLLVRNDTGDVVYFNTSGDATGVPPTSSSVGRWDAGKAYSLGWAVALGDSGSGSVATQATLPAAKRLINSLYVVSENASGDSLSGYWFNARGVRTGGFLSSFSIAGKGSTPTNIANVASMPSDAVGFVVTKRTYDLYFDYADTSAAAQFTTGYANASRLYAGTDSVTFGGN